MLTLPNILTLSRIVAVPLLALLLWPGGGWAAHALAFALYCLMGITDYFDGYVARAQGTVSKLGIFLDPIAGANPKNTHVTNETIIVNASAAGPSQGSTKHEWYS